jgi:L-iditol 2-dehydrogenase
MRQAIMTSPGKVEYRDIEMPQAGPGEVLLRIRRIGVCGSDVHVHHGKHPFTTYPVVQGHEFAGIVEALGEGVSDIPLGAVVTALPQISCGQCPRCLRGDYHICDNLTVLGFQSDGVAQDYFAIPAEKIVLLPESFTPEHGALIEPLSVAVHAVARGGEIAGRNTAVLGCGPIGNLVAQVAQAQGANVLVTEVNPRRIAVAKECGIKQVSDSQSESLADASKRVFGDAGFDLAYECAGVEATISAVIEAIAKGGTIVQLALYGQPPRFNLSLAPEHELNLIGSMMYKREDYLRSVELIASGQVKTDPLVSRHFDLDHYLEAYECIDREGDQLMKVMIDL